VQLHSPSSLPLSALIVAQAIDVDEAVGGISTGEELRKVRERKREKEKARLQIRLSIRLSLSSA